MAMTLDGNVTCPWCRKYFSHRPPSGTCDNCAGPLPPPAGADRGDAPPPPPRSLPASYRRAVMLSKNVLAIVGLVFSLVGGALGISGVVVLAATGFATGGGGLAGVILGGIGLLFATLGAVLFRVGRRAGARRLLALGDGVAAEGEILSVEKDTTQSINGRHPWRIEYTFSVGGRGASGSVTSWSEADGARQRGQPVWVVYLSSDDSISSLWPPLA